MREGLDRDPDEVLALLAEMSAATDPSLRRMARSLSAQLFLDVARRGVAARRGTGRLAVLPHRPDGSDIDLDASLDGITEARARGGVVDPDLLRMRTWTTPVTALCLLVDRSGSMTGRPLATAAVAAAAVALRSPASYSVLAFSGSVIAVKSQDGDKPAERVLLELLALRGHGTTDIAAALRAAAVQLGRARAGRRITVLLSDCRATVHGDVVGAASALDELAIMAPAGDTAEATALSAACGARVAGVSGPSDVPGVLASLLDR